MPTQAFDAWCEDVFGVRMADYRPAGDQASAPLAKPDAHRSESASPPASGKVAQKITADCKPLRNHIKGPNNHVLCQTHGHVYDEATGDILAGSVEEYDAAHKVPRPMAADCKPVHGKLPKAPQDIVLCGRHGHVLDLKSGQIIAETARLYFKSHPEYTSPVEDPFVPEPEPQPVPPPAPPEPQPPGPQPAPGPGPQPGPPPIIQPSDIKDTVTSRELTELYGAMRDIGDHLDQAIALGGEIDHVAQQQGMKADDIATVTALFGKMKTRIKDNKDLEILAIMREQIDNVQGDIETLEIMAKRGKGDATNLKTMVETGKYSKEIEKPAADLENEFDACTNAIKFFLEIVDSPSLELSIVGGILDAAGTDAVKGLTDPNIDILKSKVEALDGKVNDVIGTMRQYALQELDTISAELADLSGQLKRHAARYRNDIQRFSDKLTSLAQSLKGQSVGEDLKKATTVFKAIKDAGGEVATVQQIVTMHNLATRRWQNAFVPLGALIIDSVVQPGVVGAMCVYRNGRGVNAFNITAAVGRQQIEEMAPKFARIDAFRRVEARVRTLARQWSGAVDQGLGL